MNKSFLIATIVLLVIFLIVFGMSLGILIMSEDNKGSIMFSSLNNNKDVELVYENLTNEEIKFSKSLVDNIEEDYLSKVNKIIFTKTFPEGLERNYGLSYQDSGKIYINWNYEMNDVKTALCHEILHLFISVPSSKDYSNVEHRIIRAASKKGVCYIK